MNGERGKGCLRREGRIGGAHRKLHRQGVDRGDLLEQTGVAFGVAFGADNHQVAGRFFGDGFGRGFGGRFAAGQFGRGGRNGWRDFLDGGLDGRGQFGRGGGQGRRYFFNRLLDIAACSCTGGDGQSGEEK